METIGQIIGWVGLAVTAITGTIAGIRSLVRGPKEDKALESEVQDRIVAMAERWLAQADKRLELAEAKADVAQKRADQLEPRVEDLENNLDSALTTIELLYSWGLSGGGEPVPKIPKWIKDWLQRKESKWE